MVIVSITFVICIHSMVITTAVGDICDDADEIQCSNVYDPVCGMSEASDGVQLIRKYQNICHLTKTRCLMKYMHDLRRIQDEVCDIKKKKLRNRSRRMTDFSIAGAHEACNHTCPTYCVDTYEPACAKIWKNNMADYEYRPMINHCHIDLYSCAFKVNVTITSLGSCYKNAIGLTFMSQVAALKSLKLLDDTPLDYRVGKYSVSITGN